MNNKFEQWLKDLHRQIDKRERLHEPKSFAEKIRAWKNRMLPQHLKKTYRFFTNLFAILFILHSKKIHPSYNMNAWRGLMLGIKMWRNSGKIFTGSSFRAHLLMARKLLEIPPSLSGAVVECGAFKGGSAANLSLVCKITGRKLIIYDSFEGLPDTGDTRDAHFHPDKTGILHGSLEEVTDNITRYGSPDVCEFRKGWFHQTLPHHREPIIAMFIDVDYQLSLHDCMVNLWPHLHERGYCFLDEYTHIDYCSLFYSEKYWRKYFDRAPPGLIGAGSGVPLGEFYFGPEGEKSPVESRTSIAYTRKNMNSEWQYYPDETNNRE